MKKILMIVGSLRQNSFNMQLAKKVAQLLADKADTDILEYADVPFMNQDYEFPTPESVQKARQMVLHPEFSPGWRHLR